MMKQLDHTHRAILFVAMGLCVLSLIFAGMHLSSPSDGTRLGPEEPFGVPAWKADGILATPLEDTIDGLQQNDLIVAIEGTSIERWTQVLTDFSFPRPQWKAGQLVTYSVIRNGIRLDVPIRLRPYQLDVILTKIGLLPVVVITFLM